MIYCMSDIHGCLSAFEDALGMFIEHLDEPDTKLILLGDYVHGYDDGYGVLDRITGLQRRYGSEKVIALMGNHEEMVCDGSWPISGYSDEDDGKDDKYINWMCGLPRYYAEGKTIFVHAGIDEEAEGLWDYAADEYMFTQKHPAQTGHFYKDYKIVAGHIGTSKISGDRNFHGIYYDGQSHYYIDSTVIRSGYLNVLKVDIENQRYFEVTEYGDILVAPYDE